MGDLPTTDPRASPGKTVSLQPARSYAVPGGPQARNLGRTEVRVLSEIVRGGDDDRCAGRGT